MKIEWINSAVNKGELALSRDFTLLAAGRFSIAYATPVQLSARKSFQATFEFFLHP